MMETTGKETQMRTLQINIDGRDAHYLQEALSELEFKLYQRSADSADDMERWRQVRELKLRTGRAIMRQQKEGMELAESNR